MPYPNVFHLPGEDISPSTDIKPATISQPLINSIPPDLLPRFDPIYAKYYAHYSAGRLATHQIPIKESRANPRKYNIVYGRAIAPDVHSITDVQCPVTQSSDGKNSITVRIFEPAPTINEGKPRPAYINFHGGGWVFGGLETDMEFCKRLVGELGCVVFDVDYRLAPEYQWPIPVDDCIEAFKWIESDEMVQKRNLDRQRFAVGGISAGGMLAAVNCKVSPIQANNFEGLAPALIMTAEMDPLRDEDTFMSMDDILENGKRYNREAIRALAAVWGIDIK
ncbi:hypothetical protein BPOR_0007g00100 [Botrytis porri]|uniref:Alpha/beta hydrolase fold-3 domain-containing protein n=1 Tax=Botrytis porri TaxID=87229 RepID=A0A4Z1L6D0_9HELO|nr:hypothetical protein BPOR_0007g00100 [Botrytis porri]